jgi:hypothetical protein
VFNALWLNAQELNGTGQLQRIIGLGATASAGATATPPVLYRRRGLQASVTCGAAQTTDLYRRRSITAAVSAGAVTPDSGAPMSPRRMMYAHGFVLTDSLLGASFTKLMAADVTCGATGIMFPFDALLEASVTCGASVESGDEPELVRVRKLGASASLGASADAADAIIFRQAFADVHAGATAVASPDTIIGGTRYAEFGADVVIGANAECTIDPTKILRGEATVFSTAQATPAVFRYVRFESNPQLAGATANFPLLSATVHVQGAPVTAGVPTTEARLGRKATFLPAAAAAGAKVNQLPRLRASRVLSADVDVHVTVAEPALLHYRGLSADVSCGAPMAFGSVEYAEKLYALAFVNVDAEPVTVKLAEKLAGEATCGISGEAEASVKLAVKLAADVTAGASAEPAQYFTIRQFGGEGTIEVSAEGFVIRSRTLHADVFGGATASATVWINLYDPEPDFRTLVVDAEDWSDQVDAEDWTLTITDDSQTIMKTFTKQPAEILGYDIDFRTWFEQIPNDDIQTATCVVVSATSGDVSDLTVEEVVRMTDDDGQSVGIGSALVSHRVKVWLSGGNDGVTYKLTLTIETEDGRKKEVDFKLKVKET